MNPYDRLKRQATKVQLAMVAITVLVYGRVIACGKPEEIRNNEEVKRAYLGDQHAVTSQG